MTANLSSEASSDSTTGLLTVKTVIFSSLLLTTICCNLLALLVLLRKKTRRPSLQFTTALCLENSLLGGSLLIFIIISTMRPNWTHDGEVSCYAVAVMFTSHLINSVWIGLLVSIDRFIAVKYSLRYHSWITNRTCLLLLGLTFLASLAISLLQLSGRNLVHYQPNLGLCLTGLQQFSLHCKLYGMLIVFLVSVAPLLTNSYIYGSIYLATKNTTALARRNSFQPLTLAEPCLKHDEDQEKALPSTKQGIRKLSGQLTVHKDNRKAAKTGFIIILAEILFFLPLCILIILSTLKYTEKSEYDWLVIVCLFLDCVANPVVYVLRSKSSRRILLAACKASRHSQSLNKQRPGSHTPLFFRLVASQSSSESILTS